MLPNPGRGINERAGRSGRVLIDQLAGPGALLVGTVAIVLVPYATVTLRHRQALLVQGAGILAVVLVMLVVGVLYRRRRPLDLAVLRVPLLGLGLWAAAALAGGVSGVVHGNNGTRVAGQLLSLGLLPLGALAGALLAGRGGWLRFRCGLVGATALAALAHLGYWVVSLSSGAAFDRLLLRNEVSPAPMALLALLAALSLTASERRLQRVLGIVAAAAITAFMFGAAVRSLWVVAVIAVFVFGLWTGVRAEFPVGRLATVALALIVGALGVVWMIAAWLQPARPDFLPNGGIGQPVGARDGVEVVSVPTKQGDLAFRWTPSTRGSVPLIEVRVDGEGVYRLRAWLRGGDGSGARLALHCGDRRGVYCGSGYLNSRPTQVWRYAESIFQLPAGSARCHLYLETNGGATGAWFVRPLRLERLGDATAVPLLAMQLHGTYARTVTVLTDVGTGKGVQDGTIADRLEESAAVLRAFEKASLADKVLGRGLGATFPYRSAALDAQDRWQPVESQNYIHNFFLFLLFKLGVVGAFAIVAALAGWIGWTAGLAGRALPRAEGVFLVAAAVAWASYALWSVACPEILDFRVAPLWGLLLAASANAAVGDELPARPDG